MNNTNITPEQREELLVHAKLVDLIDTGGISEFSTLTAEADRFSERFKHARTYARWLIAIRKHGSPAQAVEAAQRGRDEARRQYEQLNDATSEIRQARDALRTNLGDNKLTDLFKQLSDADSTTNDLRAIANNMRSTRNAKVAALIEDGIPEDTALSVAKPSLAEIEAKFKEADDMPDKISALRAAVRTYEAKVNYLYPLPTIE